MLILRLIRFIRGYVVFSAQKGFPERFINLSKRFGIALWDLKISNGVITACTDCASYKKIRLVSRRSGMKTRMISKHGLAFFLNKHSGRVGLIAGALTGVALVVVLSSRIWLIDVCGNSSVPDEKIISVFEELGVAHGAAAGRIEVSDIEKEAAKLLPELTWLNVNIDGCSALIEVREVTSAPELQKDNSPCNIVAARDGTLVQLRPFSGTQEQKIGSAVLKGDLLISGINENRDLTVSFCRADGYVVARTNRELSLRQLSTLNGFVETEEKRGYILHFLVFDIPIGRIPENGFAEEKKLCVNGVNLPLSITCIREAAVAENEIKLSDERASLLAEHRFLNLCQDEFRGVEIEKHEIVNNRGEVSGKFICLENIAEVQPMLIEEGSADNTGQ